MRLGIVGATGAVGRMMLAVLAEREFPFDELRVFASPGSVGQVLACGEYGVTVEDARQAPQAHLDIALLSAGSATSRALSPQLVAAGAVVIDNSSAFRADSAVPLVIAQVNPHALVGHQGLVANPNCSTMQMLIALAPLDRAAILTGIVVTTYQAVSGAGQRGVNALLEQTTAHLAEQPLPEHQVFRHPIAFNALPQVEQFIDGDDYTSEERKLITETAKILGRSIPVSPTAVRVPVVTGHGQAIRATFARDYTPEEARQILAQAPGVTVLDDPATGSYPMPIDAAGQDQVLVGRIRQDPFDSCSLNLWAVGDNTRIGAATNAVQIAELLLNQP